MTHPAKRSPGKIRARPIVVVCITALAMTGWIPPASAASAAAGALDTTFSGDGKVQTDFGSDADFGFGVAIQGDGKVVVAGYTGTGTQSIHRFAVARYTTGGKLDKTFSGDGKVTTGFSVCVPFCIPFDAEAADVAIQPNGKIVVVGYSGGSFAIVRYNKNGTLDTTFSGDGKQTTSFTSFGGARASAVLIQPNGKIVAAGSARTSAAKSDFALARYNPNGSLDPTFSGDGKQMTDFGSDTDDQGGRAALQANGRIVVAGSTYDGNAKGYRDFALARYLPNGSLDSTFSFDGKVTTDFAQSDDQARGVALQANGRIVVAGTSGASRAKFALARYTKAGSLDSSFSGDGRLVTPIRAQAAATAVAIQANGKIVAVGFSANASNNFDFALARYKPGGALDPTFGGDGKVITNFGTDRDIAADVAIRPSNGKIVVAGGSSIDFAVARYLGA